MTLLVMLIIGLMPQPMVVQSVLADGTLALAPLPVWVILLRSTTALVGVFALASAVQRWYFGKVGLVPQLLLFFASLSLITPSELFDGLGLAVLVLLFFYQRVRRKVAPEEVEATPAAVQSSS